MELLLDLGVDFLDLSVLSGSADSWIPRSSFLVFAFNGATMSLMKSLSSPLELLADFLLRLPVLVYLEPRLDDFFDLAFLASAVFYWTN